MSELPNGWVDITLEELCGTGSPIIYGILQPGPDTPGGIAYVRPTEIDEDQILLHELRRTTPEIAAQYRRSTLAAGDVLLSIVGTIGKVAIVPPELHGGNITQSSCRVRANSDIASSAYLAQFLRSPIAKAQYGKVRLGTAVPRLNLADVREIRIPIAPEVEQRRIVAKLDSLRARTARARQELDHISKLIERYKQAILAKAFSGELTKDWPNSTFYEVVIEGLVGLVRSASQQHDDIGTPYIRMNHYDVWGEWNDEKLTKVEASANELERYELRENDVLFNTRNSYELVGKVAIWPAGKPGFVYNNNLLRLRFKPVLDAHFAAYFMISPPFRTYLASVKSATTSICAIYQRSLMAGTIPVPPMETQRAVVHRIDHAFAWLDNIATEYARAEHLLPKLDQAILAKAFRGELVPQDPNDEPASVLLELIKAERAGDDHSRRRAAKT